MIREIVTKKSITLFQDDTGIPYKYMKDKDFTSMFRKIRETN